MSRRWDVFANHVGVATRTSAGTATGALACGEYAGGQLVLTVVSLAAGGKVKAYWQSSLDGTSFGTLAAGPTAVATGTYILTPLVANSLGRWARARWTVGGSTGIKFGIGFVLQE